MKVRVAAVADGRRELSRRPRGGGRHEKRRVGNHSHPRGDARIHRAEVVAVEASFDCYRGRRRTYHDAEGHLVLGGQIHVSKIPRLRAVDPRRVTPVPRRGDQNVDGRRRLVAIHVQPAQIHRSGVAPPGFIKLGRGMNDGVQVGERAEVGVAGK